MKSYNEMAASVLARAAVYEAKRKRNQKRAAACCLCLAAVVGFGVWRSVTPRSGAVSAAQFASEEEAAAHGGLDTIVDSSVKSPQFESERSGDEGKHIVYDPSSREDAPAQGPYLESPGRAAVAGNAFYGGVYMDAQGVTHVLLTEDTPENRAAARSIVPLPDEAVVFDTVTYSRAYLESLQDKVAQGMIDKSLPFVTASALDDRGNCIRVTVTTDNEAELAKLRACDTLGGALVIERGATIAREDALVNDARQLPATEAPGGAEHIPATEAANDAQSVAP